MEKRYNHYSGFIGANFKERVQKVSIDAGFTCPNRDGSKAFGGCTYCNNDSFNPFYTTPEKSITQQIEEGIAFFSKKYKTQKYLAYFQAYTNTYAQLSILKANYEEALSHPDIIGLIISTRPDCVDAEKLDYIQDLSKKYYVSIEYGVESCNDRALQLINRQHTFAEAEYALKLTSERDINMGVHLVLGLPDDDRKTILSFTDKLNRLPIKTLKLHQLQIIKGTIMAHQFKKDPSFFNLFNENDYIELVIDFLERLRPDIILERFISQSPKELLIAPNWQGMKNFEFLARLDKRMEERNAFQGRLFKIKEQPVLI